MAPPTVVAVMTTAVVVVVRVRVVGLLVAEIQPFEALRRGGARAEQRAEQSPGERESAKQAGHGQPSEKLMGKKKDRPSWKKSCERAGWLPSWSFSR